MLRVPSTKQEAVDAICDLFGAARMTVGPGSTEPKGVLALVVEELDLPIDKRLRKPELGEAIAEVTGLEWDDRCDSRGTPSGGGDTVTLVGLTRVLEAATLLLDRGRPEQPEAAAEDGLQDSALGVNYRQADGTIAAAPVALEQDWEKLERSTVAHAGLQNRLAELLRERGLDPRSPTAREPQFDLAWKDGPGRTVLCEVKSATDGNRHQQVRLGLGQILEYRYAMERRGHTSPRAVILLEVEPSNFEEEVCAAVDVEVATLDGLRGRL